MYCDNCNREIPDDSKYCPLCGAKMRPRRESYGQPRRDSQPIYYQPLQYTEDTIPEEWKPITMWGYFGYELLFCIPVVGFILLLVFSFGGTQNHNLKNFARSYFCLLIVLAIAAVVIGGIVGIGILGSSW